MKQVGYILAFYIILLAAIPCCLADNCPNDKTEQSVPREQGDEDCGNCSPFFRCEECAPATVNYEPFQFDFSIQQAKPAFTAYQQRFLQQTMADFWQPPRLG